jgi:hypothetical protein
MIDRYPGLGRSRAGKFLLHMAEDIEGHELEARDEVELERVVKRITEYLEEKVGSHDLSDVLHTVEHTLDLESPGRQRPAAAQDRSSLASSPGRGSEHLRDKTPDRGCDPYYWG